ETGQPLRARETVQPLANDLDDGLGVNAALLLASTYEAGQEPHRAEGIYLEIEDEARFLFQRQEARDNAARLRIQRGDAAGAVELYERLLEMTPEGSSERAVYELRLGEAQALATVGTGPSETVPPVPARTPAVTPPPSTTGN